MPRLTQATAAKRRMHILQAAMLCILEQGLAVSLDDVCTRAGISKGAFYSHFPSREVLIHAVMELVSSELGELDDDSLDALADSIVERQIGPALPAPNARFGIEIIAASVSDPGLRDFNIANLENLRIAVEQAARGLIAAGKARADADPMEAGWMLQAYVLGVLCRNAVWSAATKEEIRVSVRHLIEALLGPRA